MNISVCLRCKICESKRFLSDSRVTPADSQEPFGMFRSSINVIEARLARKELVRRNGALQKGTKYRGPHHRHVFLSSYSTLSSSSTREKSPWILHVSVTDFYIGNRNWMHRAYTHAHTREISHKVRWSTRDVQSKLLLSPWRNRRTYNKVFWRLANNLSYPESTHTCMYSHTRDTRECTYAHSHTSRRHIPASLLLIKPDECVRKCIRA